MKHYAVPGFLKYCEKTLVWYDRCTDTNPVDHSVYLPIGLIMSILRLSILLNVFTFILSSLQITSLSIVI